MTILEIALIIHLTIFLVTVADMMTTIHLDIQNHHLPHRRKVNLIWHLLLLPELLSVILNL